MYLDSFVSVMRREVARTMRKYHNPPRVGLVSSYDSKTHSVKIQYQPEGTESAWIPLTGLAVGNGYGIASAPNIGDPVEVHNQESNHLSARVMTRHWSHQNKPPELQAGEHAIIHQNGATIHAQQDGTLLIGGPGYTKTGQNTSQSGNTTTESNGGTGQQQQQQQQQQPNGKQIIKMAPDGSMTIEAPNGDVILQSDNNIVYIISQPKKTHCVTQKGAAAVPVALADGGVAKTLCAEPDLG